MVNIFSRMFKKMHMDKIANLIEKQSLSKKLDLATIPYPNNVALIFKHGTYKEEWNINLTYLAHFKICQCIFTFFPGICMVEAFYLNTLDFLFPMNALC